MIFRFPLLAAWLGAFLILSCPGRADWLATGKFNYTNRLYNETFYTSTEVRPVREADVQIYDVSTNAVLATGATDRTGNFSIQVPDASTRTVAVRVVTANATITSLNFSVIDELTSASFSYRDATTDRASHAPTQPVDFGTITMPSSIGSKSTASWLSQAFNIYDMCLAAADWVASAEGNRPTVTLTVQWNPNSGRTGSFYTSGARTVTLSGDDGYCDPVILHEVGHFVEDVYGRSRNTGGTHYYGDNDQDPRLSFSEGFASYVAAATLLREGLPRPELYVDFNSFGTSGGFSVLVEGAVIGGATNEQAVTASLYDLADSASAADLTAGVDDDLAEGQQAKTWAVLRAMRTANLPHTKMEDFWDLWLAQSSMDESMLTAAFSQHHIDFKPDAQEPNDLASTATPLTVNGSYQENTFYRTGSLHGGDEDWFKFTAVAGTTYSLEVNGTNSAIFGRPDPEMWLLNSALNQVLAYNDDPYDSLLNTVVYSSYQDMAETVPQVLWQAPATGTYYLYLRHNTQARALAGRYGTYQLRVRSFTPTVPAILEVSAQRMLPGQTYQALIRGSGFTSGATISTAKAGITFGPVRYLGPTALSVTVKVDAAATSGAISYTITTAGGSASNSLLYVEATAQPPVVISEVNPNDHSVEVKNLGTVAATLTGWSLQYSQYYSGTYTFPAFTLPAGGTVVVRRTSGTNNASNLYMPSATWAWWADFRGDLSLVDAASRNVDFLRWVTSPVGEHVAPLGAGGLWMAPQVQAPSTGFALARDEGSAIYRSPFGLAPAAPTLPATATGRDNATDPYEDNDAPARAPVFAGETQLAGLQLSPRPAGPAADVDWFGFVAQEGESLTAEVLRPTGATGSLTLEWFSPGDTTTAVLSTTTTGERASLAISGAATSAGTGVYWMRVSGPASTERYTLRVGREIGNGVDWITLPSGILTFTENDPALLLAPTASVAFSSPLEGVTLTVSLGFTATPADRLAVRHEGLAAGQIGVAGSTLYWGGEPLGTIAGGIGSNSPLRVSFSAATIPPAALHAVLQNITFQNVSDSPVSGHTAQFTVTNAQNQVMASASRGIAIIPVNDGPSFTPGPDVSVLEDSGAQSVAAWATNITPGQGEADTFQFIVTNNRNSLFSAQPSLTPTGSLTFTPQPNASGVAIVTVEMRDGGGTAGGGVNSVTKQFQLTVQAVNDPPTISPIASPAAFNEDTSRLVSVSGISPGPTDEAVQSVSLSAVASDKTLFPSISISQSGTNASLTLTPAANRSGTTNVTVTARDSGNGTNTFSRTFAVQVLPVNDPPSFTKGADVIVSPNAGAQSFLAWATNISSGPGESDAVQFIVTNTRNDLFSVQPAVSASGTLTCTPVPNGDGVATVTVALQDIGGATSAVQQFALTVQASNTPPTFSVIANPPAFNEDTTRQISITGISPGPAFESAQVVTLSATSSNAELFPSIAVAKSGSTATLTLVPAANRSGTATITVTAQDDGDGTNTFSRTFTAQVLPVNDPPSFTKGPDITVQEDSGAQIIPGWATAITAGPGEDSTQTVAFQRYFSSSSLLSEQAQILPNGDLKFTPAPNAYGELEVFFYLQDSSGATSFSELQSMVITITPVNDPPTLDVIPDPAPKNEDSPPFTLSLTGITSGPSEWGQTLTATVTSSNPTLLPNPTLVLNSMAGTGTLTLRPKANLSGSASVTVTLKDGGDGANSITRTFTLEVLPVNDPPYFTMNSSVTVDEDAGPQSFARWILGHSAGPEEDDFQTVDYLISHDHPELFTTAPSISPEGTLTFAIAPNAHGFVSIAVRAHDSGGGSTDTSEPRTITLQVRPVNDPPTFTKGADLLLRQNSGPQVIPEWASGISAGPNIDSLETAQSLTFSTAVDNDALFAALPTVSADGTLSFTPAPDATGFATVSVWVEDSGGGFPHQYTSAVQTFVITTSYVNDAPSFTKGADQSIGHDRGPQTIDAWATEISTGPRDELSQTVQFQLEVDQPELFASLPAVSPTGTLAYTPARGASGTATVTVRLRDDGGTADDGVDTSAPQTFRISVTMLEEELGTYHGLVQAPTAELATHERSGLVRISIGRGGLFTGALQIGATSASLRGFLDSDGVAHFGSRATHAPQLAIVRRAPLPPLILKLQLDVGQGTNQLSGALLAGGAPFAQVEAYRALYTAQRQPKPPYAAVPAELLGRFNALLESPAMEGTPAPANPPGLAGYATLQVLASGQVKISGKLAGGTPFSYANALLPGNRWPLHVRLLRDQGALSGWAGFQPSATLSTVAAPGVRWFLPAGLTRLAAGWPAEQPLTLQGEAFRSVRDHSLLPGYGDALLAGNAQLHFMGDTLTSAGFVKIVNVFPNNAVIPAAIGLDRVTLGLTSSGLAQGKIFLPGQTRSASFQGILLPSQNRAAGFYTSPAVHGPWSLQPKHASGE